MTDGKIYAIDELRALISPIAAQYGVGRIFLFGSYARGQATENSDVDLRIDKGNVKGLFTLGALYSDLYHSAGILSGAGPDLGALILAGLYLIVDSTVLPTITQRIKDMFDYAG